MLRFVLIVLVLMLICFVALKLAREMRTVNVDWKGLGFAAAFVALAFYLRHATGLG